eukprot:TRINITY_DN3492_c0_g1_i2.p1 TRINITY_DN3492_c0_g1~~TRINITY_DN3492_c0_g1_i2.p1  ORF type:complete len:598 (+),score=110.32 TRINITY_DN3492_c0_g1_i2:227-2020(+)
MQPIPAECDDGMEAQRDIVPAECEDAIQQPARGTFPGKAYVATAGFVALGLACVAAAASLWHAKPLPQGEIVRSLSFATDAEVCGEHCCQHGESAYAVKNEYANTATACGHVECGSGRFVGSECTNRESDPGALDVLHHVMTARNAQELSRTPLHKAAGEKLERRLQDAFPDENTMTATSELMTTEAPEIAKKKEQQGQAYCAGSISGATLYSAGLGLQIASAVFYCAKEVTAAAPEKCSRQVFAMIEDMSITAKYSLEADEDCSGQSEACGLAVDDMLTRTFDMGVAASRMAETCKRFIYAPGTTNHFSCGGNLQKLVSNFPDFIGDITEGMRVCKAVPEEGFVQDYGLCIGGVLSVCGYIAGAALQLEYIPRSCGDPKTDKENGPQCSTTVGASLQTLATAASATLDSAGSCGGLDTDCGQDLTDMASSLFNVQTGFSNVATFCTPSDFYRHSNTNDELVSTVEARCAAAITNGIQGLSVVSTTALDAANSCAPDNDNSDNNECGSGISAALASFSSLAGQLSEAFLNCRHGALEYYGFYKCAANFERIANIADTTSEAIGDAVAHCGIQKLKEAAKQIPPSPIQLPRRFYRSVR